MSIMKQAAETTARRSTPEQVVVLTNATAFLDHVERGADGERQVRIDGIDSHGAPKTAHVPFVQSVRGDAAVLADQVSRTGEVVLRGSVQLGARDFRADVAESGDAVFDRRDKGFDLKAALSHGLSMLKGRSDDAIEASALMAHANGARGR
jgi:hypothetical protein